MTTAKRRGKIGRLETKYPVEVETKSANPAEITTTSSKSSKNIVKTWEKKTISEQKDFKEDVALIAYTPRYFTTRR